MYHLFYKAADSYLVSDVVSSPINMRTKNTSSMKWLHISIEASIYFPLLHWLCWYRMLCGCLPPYHSAYMLKMQTSKTHILRGDQKLIIPHGSQCQPWFTLSRDPPSSPASSHTPLQWEGLPLMPQLHVFWVCRSLNLGCTPSCTYMPTPWSGDYDKDLKSRTSCSSTCAPPKKGHFRHQMSGGS